MYYFHNVAGPLNSTKALVNDDNNHNSTVGDATSIDVSCDENGLSVKGSVVKLSEIIALKTDCWTALKDNIIIFALDKVIIDADIKKPSARVSIIAPTFEIADKRIINVDGEDGAPYTEPAKNGVGTTQKGDDGQGGHAGKPAGSVLAVANVFASGNNLEIYSRGGSGGVGQSGGNGLLLTLYIIFVFE